MLAKTGFPSLYLIHTKQTKQMAKQITFNQYMKLQTPAAIQTRENWKALQTKRGWSDDYMMTLMKEGFKQLRKGGLV